MQGEIFVNLSHNIVYFRRTLMNVVIISIFCLNF